jgi:hypothetical protein
MVGLIRPDGTPVEQPDIEYASGGFSFKTPALPSDLLNLALTKARQALARQDPIGATQLDNPFAMEPAAQAAFMFLVQEVGALNETIAKLQGQVDALENKPAPSPATHPIPFK